MPGDDDQQRLEEALLHLGRAAAAEDGVVAAGNAGRRVTLALALLGGRQALQPLLQLRLCPPARCMVPQSDTWPRAPPAARKRNYSEIQQAPADVRAIAYRCRYGSRCD